MKKVVFLRAIVFITGILLFNPSLNAQGLETFDNLGITGTSYQDGTFTGQDGSEWTFEQCRGDYEISGKAIMIGRNRTPQANFYSGTITGGIGIINFDYQQAFSTNVNLNVLVNDVVVGTVTSNGEQGTNKNSGDIIVNVSGNVVIKFINVNNGDGQVVVDNVLWTAFSDGGNLPPSITDITQTPDSEITSSTSVSVSANVTDSDGTVALVELLWGIESGSFPNSINMSASGGDTFATITDIPAQADGTTVYYKIFAEDNEGASFTSASQNYTVNDPSFTTLPYEETFDSDLGNTYVYSVLGNTKFWNHHSSGYVQMNGYDSGDTEEDWLILPGINMDIYDDIVMNFETWRRFGSDDDDNYLKLFYSSDYDGIGNPELATWNELSFNKPTTSEEQVWTASGNIDLNALSGASVWIAFKYRYEPGSYVLWQVDNVSIQSVTVLNPEFFLAEAVSPNQIDLSFEPNAENNNVLIVHNTDGNFDEPTGTPPVVGNSFAGGTLLYNGTISPQSHSGLEGGQTIYYKAFSYDGVNYSPGLVVDATTPPSEPSNHPTNFTAESITSSSITLTWDDAVPAAENYLIMGSDVGFGDIGLPEDGIPEADGALVKNVAQGVQNHQFTGLLPSTTYYFKIFPYNGIGATINYKTDGEVPQASATTLEYVQDYLIDFDDENKWTAGAASLTGYASDHIYVDGVFSSTGGPALRNTTTEQDGFPGAKGTYSWRLRNIASVDWQIKIATGGVETFSLEIRRWDDSPSPDFNLEYSTDEGENWVFVDIINNESLDNSSDWKTFNGAINSGNNEILIRLVANGATERIMIDNFSWEPYAGAPPTVATPSFLPPAGTYNEPINVTITSSTPDAIVFYSSVSASGPWAEYESAVQLSENTTLWAYATLEGYTNSNVASAIYEFISICNEPYDLSADNVTHQSARLNWTAGGAETLWNIAYGPAGFNPGEGMMITEISTNLYNIEGLDPETDYDFYIQAVCGILTSTWAGPGNFSTSEEPPTPFASVLQRPQQIDLSDPTSQSAVLMQLGNYTNADARYRLYNGSNQYACWDGLEYVTSSSYSLNPQVPGDPTTNSTFWVLFLRGNNINTVASYRDRLGPDYTSNHLTTALPEAIEMINPYSINLSIPFTGSYPLNVKYVILGFDAEVEGNLISAASSEQESGAFVLRASENSIIKRIEVRTLSNEIIDQLIGSWPAECLDVTIINFPDAVPNACAQIDYFIDFTQVIVQNDINQIWTVEPSNAGEINQGLFALNPNFVGGTVIISLYAQADEPCEDDFASVQFEVFVTTPADCPDDIDICINEESRLLNEALPQGGVYTGIGIIEIDGAYYFNPSIPGVGTYEISYTYIDINDCSQSCSFLINVKPLPEFDCPEYGPFTVGDDPVALIGPGIYIYEGELITFFHPSTVGIFTLVYKETSEYGCEESCEVLIVVNDHANICPDPFDLLAEDISDNSATLTWSSTGVSNIWNIEYGPEGFEQGQGITIQQSLLTSYSLENLMPETSYAFYVQSVCDESVSGWAGPAIFTTLTEPLIPYVNILLRPEQIDLTESTSQSAVFVEVGNYTSDEARYRLYNGGSQYNCWDGIQYIASTSYALNPQIPGTPSGNSAFWILFKRGNNNSTLANYRDRLGPNFNSNNMTQALPPADAMLNPYTIEMAIPFEGSYFLNAKYVILGYDAENGGSLISATSSDIITGAFILKAEEGTEIRRIEVRTIYNELVEQLVGLWPNPCYPPIDISVDNVTYDAATLNWVPGGNESSWNIQYGYAGFELGSGTTIYDIENNTYTLESLLPSTEYQFYLQSNCTGLLSEWVGPISFNTDIMLMIGDANCDGEIDVLDVITVINKVLELDPHPFCNIEADANEDGIIDILDAIMIINMILEQEK